MTPTPITDRLRAVVGAEAHASSPTRTHDHAGRRVERGGEYDAWYALPARSRRRLIGAGWARKGAMQPDELADLIARNGGPSDYREALEFYYRLALLAIDERRRAYEIDTRNARAKAAGQPSYFHYRNQQARAAGHASLWQYRKSKGWGSGRRPKYQPNWTLINQHRSTEPTTTETEPCPSSRHQKPSENCSSGQTCPSTPPPSEHGSTGASSLKTTSPTTAGAAC